MQFYWWHMLVTNVLWTWHMEYGQLKPSRMDARKMIKCQNWLTLYPLAQLMESCKVTDMWLHIISERAFHTWGPSTADTTSTLCTWHSIPKNKSSIVPYKVQFQCVKKSSKMLEDVITWQRHKSRMLDHWLVGDSIINKYTLILKLKRFMSNNGYRKWVPIWRNLSLVKFLWKWHTNRRINWGILWQP